MFRTGIPDFKKCQDDSHILATFSFVPGKSPDPTENFNALLRLAKKDHLEVAEFTGAFDKYKFTDKYESSAATWKVAAAIEAMCD